MQSYIQDLNFVREQLFSFELYLTFIWYSLLMIALNMGTEHIRKFGGGQKGRWQGTASHDMSWRNCWCV